MISDAYVMPSSDSHCLKWAPSWRRIAFVGVAKNSGKTTTLNFALGQAARRGESVALMSLGIDGESTDALLGTSKPKIYVEPGQWVVTAQKAVENSSVKLEYRHSLGFQTPLGEVFVGRVLTAGNVILAGLRHRKDVLHALEVLGGEDIDRILIDGAYGRIAAASAEVADAIVVSTGAVVSADIQGIVEKTAGLLEPFRLPVVEFARHRMLLERAQASRTALLGMEDGQMLELPHASALVGLSRAAAMWTDWVDAIAIPGLVSERVAELLLGVSGRRRTLLVADGTAFHLDVKLWRRLGARWDIFVRKPGNVVALSVNPTGVQGNQVVREDLIAALHERWPDFAVFDPLDPFEPLHVGGNKG